MFRFDVVNYVPDYNWRKWGTHPPAPVFNPSQLDTDQWIRAAKAAGAKYAVLVAKHCSGFSYRISLCARAGRAAGSGKPGGRKYYRLINW